MQATYARLHRDVLSSSLTYRLEILQQAPLRNSTSVSLRSSHESAGIAYPSQDKHNRERYFTRSHPPTRNPHVLLLFPDNFACKSRADGLIGSCPPFPRSPVSCRLSSLA